MMGLGVPELLIIGVIALLIFGPKKLPELGKGLGKSIRDFKDAMSEKDQPENEQAKNKEQDKHETVSK
ncbi:MAG TPA: twin-arginine translocase TatA/TatE family subunit [Terriglobia bacterium]|nr:twin-arginine translocase TatA/TatE family subunit [Terriglobia bacterium]